MKGISLLILCLLFSCCVGTLKNSNSNSKTVGAFKYTLIDKSNDSYVLRIEHINTTNGFIKSLSGSYAEYSEILHYYSYQMNKDIYSTCANGEKQCLNYHFERVYDLTNFINITFSVDDKCAEKVVINDQLLNNGVLKFKI